ncbi:hypothetical protein B296_00037774 [Ensete ventricosum]|uniref:Uncharacterized protein n=1 Tax=Ensete ventricosum TaxID=4639 RepID=A0A426ZQB5_ENSVE|nr:hypothetical protein B296_00037774 [Ensete ventricosum]
MMGSRQKFAKRFIKGIRKLIGNAKGDCREEDRRTCHKITGGCRSMWDGDQQVSTGKQPRWWVNHPYQKLWVAASGGQRVNRLSRWVNRPYPDFSDMVGFWLRF